MRKPRVQPTLDTEDYDLLCKLLPREQDAAVARTLIGERLDLVRAGCGIGSRRLLGLFEEISSLDSNDLARVEALVHKLSRKG